MFPNGTQVTIEDALLYPDSTCTLISFRDIWKSGLHVTETIANAIKEVVVAYNALPTNLFESVDTLPGFELEHKFAYYAYLVANPDTARAFINLPFEYKLSWVTKFVTERF
jgi:hypothetical protein